MLKKIFLLLFISTSYFTFSHPHVFIDLGIKILGTKNAEISWTFDLIESENKLYIFDDNGDGLLNDNEITNLYNEGFKNLKDFNYFMNIKKNDEIIKIYEVSDFVVFKEMDHRLTYKFRINIPDLQNNDTLAITHFDTSYFISFSEPKSDNVIVDSSIYYAILKNNDKPYYYDPNGARNEVLDTSKPKPGWLVAYPTEVYFSTKPIINNFGEYKIGLKEKIIQAQRFVYFKLSEQLLKIKANNSIKLIIPILLLSFLYGVIHALGPGHRKIIISSYILSRENISYLRALSISMLSALIHSGMGILIILILRLSVIRIKPDLITATTNYIEKISLYGILLLSIFLIILKIIKMLKNSNSNNANKPISLFVIIFSSLVPCPGAITIMLFSLTLSAINIGILTVLFMSLGIGITLTIISLITLKGKNMISTRGEKYYKLISYIMEWTGLLVLLTFSLFMIYSIS